MRRTTTLAHRTNLQDTGPADRGQRPVRRDAQDPDQVVRRVLALARAHLGTEVAWVSRFEATAQVLTHVEAEEGAGGPLEGSWSELDASYCLRVLDGRLPRVVPDARTDLRTRELPATRELSIGSYVGTPLRDRCGRVRGMLCCTSRHADPGLVERDLTVLEFLAGVLADVLQEGDDRRDLEAARRARVEAVVAGEGRHHVLQPVVDVDRGSRVGVEALARFAEEPERPDAWFAEAHRLGLGTDLEVAAARSALASLTRVGPDEYVSVNLSPETVLEGRLAEVLVDVDASRVVVELTEHTPVADYAALADALRRHRDGGLRLAVDDAGAGYASFRHILNLRPDYIKIDLTLVRDVDTDLVKQSLVSSLRTFGRDAGAAVVAEGVETQRELDTLARLGITLMQGYLLGRPGPAPPAQGYPRPGTRSAVPRRWPQPAAW